MPVKFSKIEMKLELTSIYLYPSLEVCTRQEQALLSFHFNLPSLCLLETRHSGTNLSTASTPQNCW